MKRPRPLVTHCPECGAEGSIIHVQVRTTDVLYVIPDFGTCVDIGTDHYQSTLRCIHCAVDLFEEDVVAAAVKHGKDMS